MSLTVMAAVARGGVIGLGGSIPWHLSADLRRFKQLTMGHTLVMGRRTYESIGRPLPGRTTIVVTRDAGWLGTDRPAGLHTASSLADALRLAETLGGETFVQGGAALYAEAIPLADRLAMTWVDAEPAGDTFFPDVDWSMWREESREPFDGGVWATYVRRPDGAG